MLLVTLDTEARQFTPRRVIEALEALPGVKTARLVDLRPGEWRVNDLPTPLTYEQMVKIEILKSALKDHGGDVNAIQAAQRMTKAYFNADD